MDTRLRMYVAGIIAAFAGYLFVSLAFSGQFNVVQGGIFIVFFVVVMVIFATLIEWADTRKSN